MISRIWHGWAPRANADRYEALLRDEVFPEIQRVPGVRGASLLRRDSGHEVEFVTITRFTDLDAVRRFAGTEYERAVIHPVAAELLSRWEEQVAHYDMVLEVSTAPRDD